jgi:hypothetical protein
MATETITTREASRRLGVSVQRLRQLITSGDIYAERHGHVWAIDPRSVTDYDQRRRPTAGRSLSPTMAWAAMLSNFGTAIDDDLTTAFDLHGTERSRLTNLSTRQPDDWRWLAHRRAATKRFDTFDAYLDRIESRNDVVRTGVSAIADHQVDLVVHERHLDVYVAATVAAEIVTTMRLEPRSTGNLTLRSIPEIEEAGYIMNRRSMPRSVIAVDLLDDTDERTARTGSDMIRAILDGR